MVPPIVDEMWPGPLELQPCSDAGALHPLLSDFTVIEIARAHAHAAHVQAFQFLRLHAFANDDFRAAAADIRDQTSSRFARRGIRDTEIDQARFFYAGDDFDWMSQCDACAVEECTAALGASQCIGADDPDAAGIHVVQTLAEALETLQGGVHGSPVQTSGFIETSRETNHFAQTIEDGELPV